MKILKTSQQIGRTLKNAGRLRAIVSVFAKHGFYNIAERIRLGKFTLERLTTHAEVEKLTVAVRVRMSFEELGPSFVKLGQLLASRPDLVPDDFVNEFSKFHDQVAPIPFSQIEKVLQEEFGDEYKKIFVHIDQQPLGSASIAQVHRATLSTGQDVVIKVQRPGIIQTINEDLNVLYMLAELLETYVEETRRFSPVIIVDEYFKTLELETNFVVEANNIRRFAENFADEPGVQIPEVYLQYTTERVLVMSALEGFALSSPQSLQQSGVIPSEVLRSGLKAYLKMVFIDGLFHGDLHPGNFFVLPSNKIGLIDFGVVGRLNYKTQTSIASMLIALSQEDYDRLAFEYIELAPFSDKVNIDLFAKDLRDLIAPYYGLTLKDVNFGKLLLKSSSIAAKHSLSLPTDLMLYFKSLVAVESMGRKIQKDFDFFKSSKEFVTEFMTQNYSRQKLKQDLSHLAKESQALIYSLPRQLHFWFRRLNSPSHHVRILLKDFELFRKSLELSFNLLFLGLVIGGLLVAGSIAYLRPAQHEIFAGVPTLTFACFVVAGLCSLTAVFNYFKK